MSTCTARWAEPAEIDAWDSLVAENPAGGDFLVTRTFAAAKRLVGWRPRFVVFERGEAGVSPAREGVALVLERRVPLLGAYWYVTHGPSATDPSGFAEQLDALRSLAARSRPPVFGITVEPPILATPEHEAELERWVGAAPELSRREGIQGNTDTVVVDIDRDDDALIASFHKKCRNMIRRAERDGVTVREYPADAETFAHMHRLMRLVGGGKGGLSIRPRAYMEELWRGFAAAGQGRFYGIDADGSPALLAFVIRIGAEATYKDGGSERDRTTPGMSNFLQWSAMRAMRDEGATSYDMFGIAPEWATSNEDHSSYELGRFKLSFGPRVTHVGAFDVAVRPAAWKLWRSIGERVVSALHRRRYRDFSLY